MPLGLRKSRRKGGGWDLYNKDTGRTVGWRRTRKSGAATIGAIAAKERAGRRRTAKRRKRR